MAQLVKTVQGLAIASVKTFQGLSIASAKTVMGVDNTAGGGGTSPGLTNIIAWYDFANANDADGGTFNLTEANSPTYTAGPPSYGTSGNGAAAAHWTQTSLDESFANTAGDWSFVFRFQAKTGIANNDALIVGNGGRTSIEYTTGANGIRGGVGGTTLVNSNVVPAEDTWYTVVVSRNNTSGQTSISVNGATFVSGATTASFAVGNFVFGGSTTSNANPAWIDFAGFWNKVLTQDNATWLYNSGGTRTYAEL